MQVFQTGAEEEDRWCFTSGAEAPMLPGSGNLSDATSGPDCTLRQRLPEVKISPTRCYESDRVSFKDLSRSAAETHSHSAVGAPGFINSGAKKGLGELVGSRVSDLGLKIQQWLLEVFPLRSQSTGKRAYSSVFPLPTSSVSLLAFFPDLTPSQTAWLSSICMALNSMWGSVVHNFEPVNPVVGKCLKNLMADVLRIETLQETVERFDWDHFFKTRAIDYKGDEVKTAREFSWDNIAPALPSQIGTVPLAEVCTLGAKHYVDNIDLYIRPRDRWELRRAPRVMVAESSWARVCEGLLSSGICTLLTVEEIFHVDGCPLLNGLFGVTKDEWAGGHEVYRLIMNLTPFNGIAEPIKGDVDTLPMWSLMNPFYLEANDTLIVSSEDVRCFFYTMRVPCSWYKYLAFNRRVPDSCLSEELMGREVYLASQVLPMGFANSVSLAQHVHRNLALWSGEQWPAEPTEVMAPELEIRKNRPVTVGNPA